jgi:phosphate transport system substrate-binding protein
VTTRGHARPLRRIGGAVAVVCATLAPILGSARPAAAATPILGGGSGFAALEIDQWKADTAGKPFNLTVNYQSLGSSIGRGYFAQNRFDFGASDITFPPTEDPVLASTARCGRPLSTCFRYVTVSAGGLAFMYNLTDNSGNRITNLKLTRRAACEIFTGQIRQWNDPQLVATNPELANFTNRQIRVVVRSDGAGESYVLSEFCIAVASDVWSRYVNYGTQPQNSQYVSDPGFSRGDPVSTWPGVLEDGSQPNTQSGSDGVANAVADPNEGVDAITYDAAGYAKVRGDWPVASVENANPAVFTQPAETNVTVALGYATGRSDGTFQLNFKGPDPRAYFPSTYSYVLAQTTGSDPGKAASLSQFLCYAVGAGQVRAVPLAYARLSSVVVNISIAAINQIPGANCALSGPPPPPPPQVQGGPAAPGASGVPGSNGPGASTTTGGSAATSSGGTASTATAGAASSGAQGAVGAAASGTETSVAGTAESGSGAVAGQSGPSGVALASPAAASSKTNGPTNDQAIWAILEGALICAIVVGLTEWRRRAAR